MCFRFSLIFIDLDTFKKSESFHDLQGFPGSLLVKKLRRPEKAEMQAFNEDECNRINVLADKLRDGFNQAFAQAGILGNASGIGSLTNINFSEKPLNDSRDYLDGLLVSKHIGQLLHLGMLRHGVNSASRLMFCTSTAMSDREIEKAVAALHATLDELKPFVETECPELIL